MRLRKAVTTVLSATLALSALSTVTTQAASAHPRPAPARSAPSAGIVEIQHIVVRAGCSVGRSGADGRWGPGTKEGVKCYQRKRGLVADGVPGAVTLADMQRFATSRGLPPPPKGNIAAMLFPKERPPLNQWEKDLLAKNPTWQRAPEQSGYRKMTGVNPQNAGSLGPFAGPVRHKPTYSWQSDLEGYVGDVTFRTYLDPATIRRYNIHAGEGTAVFIFAICGRWPSIAAQGLCGSTIYAHLGPLKRTLMMAQLQNTCARITFTDVPPLIRSRQEKCKMTNGRDTWTP